MIDSKNFTDPNSPEWHMFASVAYFKNKLYYLGGYISGSSRMTDRAYVRRSNESPLK